MLCSHIIGCFVYFYDSIFGTHIRGGGLSYQKVQDVQPQRVHKIQEVCAFFLSTEAKKDMTALALVPFGVKNISSLYKMTSYKLMPRVRAGGGSNLFNSIH